MPINRFQRIKEIRKQAPATNILGKIFKGSPREVAKSGKMTSGKNLDYFRFAANPKGRQTQEIQEVWDTIYFERNGGEPRTLNISFPFNNIEHCLNEWYTEFGASGLKVKCDGDNIIEWRDKKGSYHINEPRPCRDPNSPTGCEFCKAGDLLQFKLFEFEQYGFDGLVQLSTKSLHDMSYLRDRLTELQQELASVNLPLRGTAMILYRETRVITKTVSGNTFRGEESLLGLSLHPSVQKEIKKALDRRLYAVLEAVGQGTIPISGSLDFRSLPSQPEQMAITPSTPRAAENNTIKNAFLAELEKRYLDTENHENRKVIGETLRDLGCQKINSKNVVVGDANKIPPEKFLEVVNKVEQELIKSALVPEEVEMSDVQMSQVEVLPPIIKEKG